MANNNDKNNKNGKNDTEGILGRIVKRAVQAVRTGTNIPEGKTILGELARRASTKEGQFYATLADPNAYYDKQGFGSAGTGMRAAQQAYQGAETARAAIAAKGLATPTSQLTSATSLHTKLQGDYGIGKPVPHPLTGEMVDYNSLTDELQAFYVREFQSRLMGMNDDQVNAMLKKQFSKLYQMKEAQDKAKKAANPKQVAEMNEKNKSILEEYNNLTRFMKKTGKFMERDFKVLMPALEKLMTATGEIDVKKGLGLLMDAIKSGATGLADYFDKLESAPPPPGPGGMPPGIKIPQLFPPVKGEGKLYEMPQGKGGGLL